MAKPLGRPSAMQIHVSPGERNPIEGKFGQAKTAYGLNRIKARLKETSETWIACIFLVLNLVKLAGVALHALNIKFIHNLMICFSAKWTIGTLNRYTNKIEGQILMLPKIWQTNSINLLIIN